MRDRLVELIQQKSCAYVLCDYECRECKNIEMYDDNIERLADHLLANGVIVPPCKVGDTLYVISKMKDKRILPFVNKYEVTSISVKKKSIVVYHEMDGYIKSFKQTEFGKTVFLTKEEAEKALKGGAE